MNDEIVKTNVRKIVFDWLFLYPVAAKTDRDEVLWKMSRRFAYLSSQTNEHLLDEFLKGHGHENTAVD